MPGLDKSRFIGFRQIEDELLCGICLAIFTEPVMTPCCRQTYCKLCITEWLQNQNTCPYERTALTNDQLLEMPRCLTNMLNKMEIKCDHNEKGCNETVLFEKLEQHSTACRYNPEAICADCGQKNGDRNEHNCVQLLLTKINDLEKSKEEITKTYGYYETEMRKVTDCYEQSVKQLNENMSQKIYNNNNV